MRSTLSPREMERRTPAPWTTTTPRLDNARAHRLPPVDSMRPRHAETASHVRPAHAETDSRGQPRWADARQPATGGSRGPNTSPYATTMMRRGRDAWTSDGRCGDGDRFQLPIGNRGDDRSRRPRPRSRSPGRPRSRSPGRPRSRSPGRRVYPRDSMPLPSSSSQRPPPGRRDVSFGSAGSSEGPECLMRPRDDSTTHRRWRERAGRGHIYLAVRPLEHDARNYASAGALVARFRSGATASTRDGRPGAAAAAASAAGEVELLMGYERRAKGVELALPGGKREGGGVDADYFSTAARETCEETAYALWHPCPQLLAAAVAVAAAPGAMSQSASTGAARTSSGPSEPPEWQRAPQQALAAELRGATAAIWFGPGRYVALLHYLPPVSLQEPTGPHGARCEQAKAGRKTGEAAAAATAPAALAEMASAAAVVSSGSGAVASTQSASAAPDWESLLARFDATGPGVRAACGSRMCKFVWIGASSLLRHLQLAVQRGPPSSRTASSDTMSSGTASSGAAPSEWPSASVQMSCSLAELPPVSNLLKEMLGSDSGMQWLSGVASVATLADYSQLQTPHRASSARGPR